MKTVTILGSTGSIGASTLRVIKSLGNEFRIQGLSCRNNISLLSRQIEEFRPLAVAIESPEAAVRGEYGELKKRFSGVEFLEGAEGVLDLASRKVDTTVSAIVGAAGLRPTIAAIGSSKRIALANKETLVMAGSIFMDRVKDSGVELIPVDSEHSAVFSLLKNIPVSDIERIILTASGGSVRDVPVHDLDVVTPDMALAHPNWDMGSKITIDSATLMNKGLEVMEAHHLFGFGYERIDIIMHPQSVIHSMVETIDGSLYAHMGITDMAMPILYSLKYPERGRNDFGRLRLEDVGIINFQKCNRERYPALELCYEAGRKGGTMPAVLNASNEVAVNAFLQEKILFTDIVKIVEKAMASHTSKEAPGLDEILAADSEARDLSKRMIDGEIKW
ncbi:MAG: 1-deoxy-D-xylulose-5-phosphate reductoisomerase [Spirochaetes bacterium]|nr:1-deoxy-D-xylulose-5-phosphate reductoisomerase [Spirochaetota bacterium]